MVVALLAMSFKSFAKDMNDAEKTCSDLGFKPRTEPYADCVVELYSRDRKASRKSIEQPSDEMACKSFGFKPGTEAFSNCRLQIETARRQEAQKQAQFELEQRKYEQELLEYQQRMLAYENERKRRQGDAMMRFGLGLMSGTSPYASENFGNAGRAALGIPPARPAQPGMEHFLINTPGGGMTSCHVIGNIVTCN
jgi:hypothetical protein